MPDHPYFFFSCRQRRPFPANSPPALPPLPLYPTRVRISRTETGSRTGSCDVTDVTADPPYLALARCALVVGVLPGATAVVDDASVAARSGVTRNRERGAVCRRLSRTGIVLAARATIALLGHGIRAGYRWTLHLPAVYFAVLQQITPIK